MKLKSISISGFRGIKKLELTDLNRKTLLLGARGVGKSTVLSALQYMFLGRCTGWDGKAILLETMVKERKSELVCEFEPNDKYYKVTGTITRSSGLTLSADTTDGPIIGSLSYVRTVLFNRLGITQEQAEFAMNPRGALLGGDLASMLDSSFEENELQEFCGDRWSSIGIKIKDYGRPITNGAELFKFGEYLYGQRTAINKAVKEKQGEAERLGSPVPPLDAKGEEIPHEQLPTAKRFLDSLIAQKESALVEQGRAQTLRPQSEIDEEVATLKAQLENCPEADKGPYDFALSLRTAAESKRSGQLVDKANLEYELGVAQKKLESIKEVCPTCGQSLPKEKIKSAKSELQKSITSMQKSLSGLDAALAESLQEITDAREQEKAERDIYESTHNRREQMLQRLAKLAKEKPQPAEKDSGEKLAQIEERITKGSLVIKALEDCQKKFILDGQLSGLLAEQELLNWGVTAFRDGEAQESLCNGARDALLASLSIALEPHGYEVTVDDGVRLNGVRAAELCGGELVLAQMALVSHFANGFLGILDGVEADTGKMALLQNLRYDSGWLVTCATPSADVDQISQLIDGKAVWIDKQ